VGEIMENRESVMSPCKTVRTWLEPRSILY
jgi:hypothetical protein